MLIQTEITPNPNSIKFLPAIEISKNPTHFSSIDEATNSTLAIKLLSVKNVKLVSFGYDFITITKEEQGDWKLLESQILMVISDHINSGLPIFDYDNKCDNNILNQDTLTDIEKQIVEIINTKIRPAVAMDGGDIIYKEFKNGVVRLELKGACHGCPSATVTLKNGIESMLKYYIPEVKSVESV